MVTMIENKNSITCKIFLTLKGIAIQTRSMPFVIISAIQNIKVNEHFIMSDNVKIYINMPN
jgi:hypothetical protein